MQRGAGPRLVLAVDYGTTSTGQVPRCRCQNPATNCCMLGVAYALADGLKERPAVTLSGWPGSEKSNGRRLKVPSRISYRQSRELPCDWGFRCQPASETYSWTKLLLGVQYSSEQGSDTNPLSDPILEGVMRMGILKLPDGKSAVEVIADFLRHINEYALTVLNESIANACQSIEGIDFWITVPATWSAEQRSLMRHAAQRAEFGSRAEDRVFFLSEPEAAMHAVAYLNGGELQTGDGVLVCDCGGGTVDAASFLVTESGSRPYFQRLSADIGMYGTDDA
ncbi:hypothetical protein P168DRAFT_289256 [Aspergillus campestris IBT 28561]|uniref:Actin-like ATPase domain-containing protein n=1 Tax=Aspergillus campestris (strain IBT 28561) TaxID=1392248 RepID=A0A2I1D7H5_ASPC2|nr:uncharacterized protein P168DRAFT_289256 [Aspergillus campestris IBT 28561]PKY05836.1 hypothetical protein P168DRAFT_289256 [Aspergillus campestris IBT 28561]